MLLKLKKQLLETTSEYKKDLPRNIKNSSKIIHTTEMFIASNSE